MIQKLIDAYELEREMYRKCIDTDEEIKKGRAKWDSGLWSGLWIRYKVFEDAITLAPRVDPIKHGHWIVSDNHHTCRCSCCENMELVDWALEQAKYCPHCGAKMNEVKKDGDT